MYTTRTERVLNKGADRGSLLTKSPSCLQSIPLSPLSDAVQSADNKDHVVEGSLVVVKFDELSHHSLVTVFSTIEYYVHQSVVYLDIPMLLCLFVDSSMYSLSGSARAGLALSVAGTNRCSGPNVPSNYDGISIMNRGVKPVPFAPLANPCWFRCAGWEGGSFRPAMILRFYTRTLAA